MINSTLAHTSPLLDPVPSCPVISHGIVEQLELCVITLMGTLHSTVALQLRGLLLKYASGGQHILISIQDVLHMDSACIAVLCEIHDQLRKTAELDNRTQHAVNCLEI